MLSAAPEVQALLKNKFQVTDITRCLCLRAHSRNPWILDNLRLQFQHFHPGPPTVVVDQGSEPQWARQVKELTLAQGGLYFYDDYRELYSPSRAHNMAAAQVKTEFIFFTDPDFLAVHDLFSRLIELINRAGLGSQLDLMINLPAVHLNESATEIFRQAATSDDRTSILEKIRQEALFDSRIFSDFVSPYSNVYLCRREGFQLSGGYDESFSGHGSEDFEFLLRFAIIMGRFPQPVRAWEDLYRPTKPDFYHSHEYAGFRSLLALMSLTAELSGLAAFHLSHPISEQAPWRNKGDRHRFLFRDRVGPYLKDRRELLERDWLPRPENLTVQAEIEAQAYLFLPLRLAGYRLRLGPPKGAEEDHKNLAVIRENGVAPSDVEEREGVVISPGQLPGSWRYLAEPENDEPLTPEETSAALALAKLYADSPESREPGWAELVFRRYSFFEDGALKQFCFRGQRLLTAERSPRLTPRAYALGRFGIMPKSQWQMFMGQGSLDDYHPDFRRWEPLARCFLKIEYKLLKRILPRQSKKWFKYCRNRAAFFTESNNRFLHLYHRIWRRFFKA